MEYRGIQIAENVRLYNKNQQRYGLYNLKVKQSIDELIDLLIKNGHTAESPYEKDNKKMLIDFKCGCGPWPIDPAKYKMGRKCGGCRYDRVGEKKSKEARESFPELVKANGHILLTPYGKNQVEKVWIDFVCGHEPKLIAPAMYKQGERCNKCHYIELGKRIWEEGKRSFLAELEANGHTTESDYIESHKKVLINFACGHPAHPMSPSCYKIGQRCPRCSNNSPEQARENYYKALEEVGYKATDDYERGDVKVRIECEKGHVFPMRPHDFVSGQRCPKCSNRCPEQAKENFFKAVKKAGFKIKSGVYKTSKSLFILECDKGHEVRTNGNRFMSQNQRCKKCSASKGEGIIREWLLEHNIKHTWHFNLYRSTNKRKRWEYDFFIPEFNLLIEVQGEQHSKRVKLFNKRTSLEKRQAMDKAKRQYAEFLGYDYLEVDYSESKPRLALERFIKAFSEIEKSKQEHKQLALF